MELQEFLQPITFTNTQFSEALDNADPTDPFNENVLMDRRPANTFNTPLYNTSTTHNLEKTDQYNDIYLQNMPDYSDIEFYDYQMKKLMGKPVEENLIIDLDTAPDYVAFTQNTIRNLLKSQNEFNIDNTTTKIDKDLEQSDISSKLDNILFELEI